MEVKSKSNLKKILTAASGNFLEMYDFSLYGFYAAIIAHIFFPSENEYVSILKSLLAFGSGFLMRPIGAIVLGSYMDKHGRKKGLILTLSLMAVGTITITVCPGYESIGILAPIIIVLGRLIQGFSAGAELGGVSVYLFEIAPQNKRGLYVAWQSGVQQLGAVFSGGVGVILFYLLGDKMIAAWGWRIPFAIGCFIIPALFLIRKHMIESPEFGSTSKHHSVKEIFMSIYQNYKVIIAGIFLVTMTTVNFYFLTTYTPTFVNKVLHFSKIESFYAVCIVGISNFIWLFVGGGLSDKIGRKKVLILSTILCIVTSYGVMYYLEHNLTFLNLVFVLLWLSFIYGVYNGAMIVALSEVMPKNVRVVGFSLSYSLAVTIFGGFTPSFSLYLTKQFDSIAAPAIWLSMAGFLGFIATLILYKNKDVSKM